MLTPRNILDPDRIHHPPLPAAIEEELAEWCREAMAARGRPKGEEEPEEGRPSIIEWAGQVIPLDGCKLATPGDRMQYPERFLRKGDDRG